MDCIMAKLHKPVTEIQEASVRATEKSKKLIDESKGLVREAQKTQKKIARKPRRP